MKSLAVALVFAGTFFASLFLLPPARPLAEAAPALVPKGDQVVGVLEIRLQSPTVVIHKGGEAELAFWLVFADPLKEAAVKKLENGSRIRVTGRLMAGGVYRYIICETVEADKD